MRSNPYEIRDTVNSIPEDELDATAQRCEKLQRDIDYKITKENARHNKRIQELSAQGDRYAELRIWIHRRLRTIADTKKLQEFKDMDVCPNCEGKGITRGAPRSLSGLPDICGMIWDSNTVAMCGRCRGTGKYCEVDAPATQPNLFKGGRGGK